MADHPTPSLKHLAFARFAYGSALMNNARLEDGVAQLQPFIRRSPKDPYIGSAYFLDFCYLTLGDFQQAEQSAHDCIRRLPDTAWSRVALAMSLGALGRDAETQQQIAKIRKLEPGLTRQHFEI